MMDSIHTRIGRADFDDYDHHGLRVFRDLSGRISYLGLAAFAISGRRLTREDEAVLDDVAVCSHVTEPRVWPIKLARIVASTSRVVPGFIAGTVALDSDMLGGRVCADAARLLLDLEAFCAAHGEDDAVIERFVAPRERIVGFGVPVRPADERLLALRKAMIAHRRVDRPYWQLAEKLWRVGKRVKNLEPNLLLALAAAFLDLGFRGNEIPAMAVMILQPTFLANAVEGADQRAPVLQRFPDEAVNYVGPPPRTSPRATQSATPSTIGPTSSTEALRF